eukprot:SAG11_NODE_37029_length_258_cov_2.245283_1_plen_39_part_10
MIVGVKTLLKDARRERWNTPNVVFCFEARWGSEQIWSGT